MVGTFRRTVSFPVPESNNPARAAAKRRSYGVRSASLPIRFGPIVVHLEDDVANLRQWSAASSSSSQSLSATWLSDGISLIYLVLASLSDLLLHPQSGETLRRSPCSDQLLEDFLRLADVHDSFRTELLNLTQLQAETRAAVRRREAARLASATRAQRRSGKELGRLASSARAAARTRLPPLQQEDPGEAALPAAICDATAEVAAASASLFSGLASLSAASAGGVAGAPVSVSPEIRKSVSIWWVVDVLRWRRRATKRSLQLNNKEKNQKITSRKKNKEKEGDELEQQQVEMERKEVMERLERLEECTRSLEISSEKVFRALVNARVSLLNIMTPMI